MTAATSRPIVFLGPTLAQEQARGILDADYRPPAAKGDVFEAVKAAPSAIGLVDGYFQAEPAVWHKEILWALSRGIPVFGAASMGAIRAAELARFGMIGVGRIYERFATGRLVPDDEVAIQHGPAELGYPALSVALVDIRATLASARRRDVVSEETLARLERIAAGVFYPSRRWETLIALAEAEGAPMRELEDFAAWLTDNTVSQKAQDAELMLSRMGALLSDPPAPAVPPFEFEPTLLWQQLVAERENPFLRSLVSGES